MLLTLWSVDYSNIFNNLISINIESIVLVCLIQLFTILLINIQWKNLGAVLGLKLTFKNVLHVNMHGTFAESITPSVKAGGEFLKAYILNGEFGIPLSKASALIVMQKTISTVVFLFMNIIALFSLLFYIKEIEIYFKILVPSLIFIFALIFLMIYSMVNQKIIITIVSKIPFIKKKHVEKLDQGLINYRSTVKTVFKQKKVMFKQLILSLLIWNLFPIKAYLISVSLGFNIGFIPILAVTYLTYMIGMIPLLPGGIGTFEASTIMLLAPVGINGHEALAFAIILRFVTFWFVFLVSGIYIFIHKIPSIFYRFVSFCFLSLQALRKLYYKLYKGYNL
ncbi:UNVERIFIED_CONTAM: hypothetical protein Cloal_4115 [Acetivibrio alkalicellulosi]